MVHRRCDAGFQPLASILHPYVDPYFAVVVRVGIFSIRSRIGGVTPGSATVGTQSSGRSLERDGACGGANPPFEAIVDVGWVDSTDHLYAGCHPWFHSFAALNKGYGHILDAFVASNHNPECATVAGSFR